MRRSKELFISAMAGLIMLFSAPAFATCTFTGGGSSGGIVTFNIPAVIQLEPDVQVGTIIYDASVESGEIAQRCDGDSVRVRRGYLSLSDADAREDVLPGVYKTNVAGIGIRVAASTTQFPSYTEEDIIRPETYLGTIRSFSTNYNFRATAQLIVIGEVEEGDLNTSLLTSHETYDNDVIGEIRFSPTSVHITTNTCNLVDKNIYVPLETVNVHDFNGQYSDILTDSRFRIDIKDCAAGTKIDYQFTSAGSTGVTDGNILNIATGDNAASGVGIQILDKNDAVLQFDQSYTAITRSQDNVPVEIPLKARYIKTGEVKAGKVDAVATFELFYR
ncbi:TPA: type 1 fimbrial protein [Enterobacter hormaechei subsp. steigerwaltii]|nr:fimbrial protein domain-containing protein [Enterobacter hormaechei]HCM9744211.1 type 1 fimbrial protein [Enterobacter hormaechei subsp. steigerwaltii]